MVLPPAITPASVPRQTLPYGDRPFVEVRVGHLTNDAYQYLSRLAQGFGATTANVSVLITSTNTIIGNLGAIEAEIATIVAEIAAIELEITGLAPPAPAGAGRGGVSLAQAFGIAFFVGSA